MNIDNLSSQSVKNLVNWKNPPTVEDLKNDLQDAKSDHDVHVTNVTRWLNILKGKINFEPKKGRSSIQPKLVRKQAEWVYSSLESPFLSSPDIFDVNPSTYDDEESAKQNALILNKQFRVDIPRTKFINKFVRTAVNTGSVLVKLGWEEIKDKTRVEKEVPKYAETEEELTAFLQQQIEQQQITQEDAQSLLASGEPIQIGTELQSDIEESVVVNRPVLQIKDSRDVIIDPTCEGDIDKARFIVDTFITDLSSLKKDGRYKNLNLIPPSEFDSKVYEYGSDSSYDTTSFSFRDKPRKKLRVYEYWGFWDIDKTGIVEPIVASFIGDTMIRLEKNPYPDKKLPFVIVQFLPPNDNSIYGEPLAELLKDNQDIIGAIQRGMIDLFGNSANGQQGIAKGFLDPLNAKRFKEGQNFEYNPIGDVKNSYFTTSYPEVPSSAFNLINFQNAEAEALTGIKSFSQGITGEALGQMLDLETLIPTGDGNIIPLKHVTMNTMLIGSDGKPKKIRKLFDINYPDKAFNLRFADDTIVKCGIEHKWSIQINGKGKYKTVDTGEIVKLFKENKNIYVKRVYRVFNSGKDPEGNPYEDGKYIATNTLSISEDVFKSSYEYKLEFLRGLMSICGHIYNNSTTSFNNNNINIINDVIRLLKSMGCKLKIHKNNKMYSIKFTCMDCPFKDNEKAIRYYKRPLRNNNIKITDIKETDKVLMRCLEVDSEDSLFAITENMILTHNSVGGIHSALDATAKRELGILRRLSDGLVNIGRKIISMNSVWLSDEEIIRVTDDQFVKIKRDDLAGDFDLSVTISTAEEDNQKSSELSFLLQTIGNNAPMDVTLKILSEIASLHKMPKLAKMLSEYQPQPDPMDQKAKELQLQLLEAQIANERAKAEENSVDVELKKAKTETELAKSGKLSSEKDKNDLEYLEKATGLTQERDLEKIMMSKKDKENKQQENMLQQQNTQNLNQQIPSMNGNGVPNYAM